MHSLYSYIKRATVLRDRLRVVPTPRGQRLPVGTQHRCHFRVGDAARPRSFVKEAAAKPPAPVGQRDELRAISRNADGRYAPKAAVRRAQDETAAELQETEPATGGVTNVECRDRLAANIDCNWARNRRQHLRCAGDRCEKRYARDERRDHPTVWPCNTTRPNRHTLGHASNLRRGAPGDSSSNSSASFSVMAPPSSSASTMVTARR